MLPDFGDVGIFVIKLFLIPPHASMPNCSLDLNTEATYWTLNLSGRNFAIILRVLNLFLRLGNNSLLIWVSHDRSSVIIFPNSLTFF